jgi:hypothetical protein
MNQVTKAEREQLLEEAKQLLIDGGYNARDEFDAERVGTYTRDHAQPIIHQLIARGLSKERARAIVAKALRQLRFKAMNGWKGQ